MIHSFDGEIAKSYGVDEAILFHQIAHWVYVNEANNRNFYDGRYWTYNSGKAYEKIFPFWKDQAIRKKLRKLVDLGLIIKSNFGMNVYDHTNWYTLTDFGRSISRNWTVECDKYDNRLLQNEQSRSLQNDQSYNNTNNTIVSDTYINTKEKTYTNILSGAKNLPDRLNSEIAKIINYLNDVLGSHYTTKSKSTNSMIKGRLEEGHTVDDFIKVIDNKHKEWGEDPKMVKYLRPETLFRASHFESYLNEIKPKEADLSKHYYQPPEFVPQTEEEKRRSQEWWDSLEEDEDV